MENSVKLLLNVVLETRACMEENARISDLDSIARVPRTTLVLVANMSSTLAKPVYVKMEQRVSMKAMDTVAYAHQVLKERTVMKIL